MNFFTYRLICRSGILCTGASDDFLRLILSAKSSKALFARDLPHSNLRIQLFSPNGRRVARSDIKAALNALSDPSVYSSVFSRIQTADAPGATTAQRAACLGSSVVVFLVFLGLLFCQAGVVAPPDSLTGETPAIFLLGV